MDLIFLLCCTFFFPIPSFADIELSRSSESRDFEFPHHVAIFCYRRMLGELKRYFVCGGSLINSYTVLTAGHCVSHGDDCEVQAGTSDLSSSQNGIISRVVETKIHEEYLKRVFTRDDKTIVYDIALLFLEDNFTETEEGIRYADIYPEQKVSLNTTAFLPGWGKDEYNIFPVHLGKITMPVVRINLCNCTYLYTNTPLDFIHDNSHLCCGDGFHESCDGDSGGGLVRLGSKGIDSVRWSIIGITSFQGFREPHEVFKNKADVMLCGTGYSGMTRISFYFDWILSHTQLTPPSPDISKKRLKYVEELSEIKRCYGVPSSSSSSVTDNRVCSGNGRCVFLDTCVCDEIFDDENQEKPSHWEYFGEKCDRKRKKKKSDIQVLVSSSSNIGGDQNFFSVIFVAIILLCSLAVLLVCKVYCK